MFLDAGLQFSSAQAVTTTTTSTNIVDLTGAGSGTAPNMIFGGTIFGADMGIGDGMATPKLLASVGTAFASTGGAPTLTIAAQFAVDNGSNAPGTYQTYAETGAIPLTALVAGANVGTFDLPKAPEGKLSQYPLPRFVRLAYTVGTTSFSAGTLNADIVLQRDGQNGGINYGSNFVVGA